MIGISSFCRFFKLEESGYHTLLHFFRSSGWSLVAISVYWESLVFSSIGRVQVQGRTILLGDHTYVPKDGRRMPGVVSLHQNSETQSKPSYFRGHCWGALGVLIGTISAPFCLPLRLSIHQGHVHIGEDCKKQDSRQTLGTRIVEMAIDISIRNNLPSILILDAYFPGGAVFKLAASVWSIALKAPMVTLIIRAKKNYTAYFPAEKTDGKQCGRPATYGEKVKLMEMFDHSHLFSKVACCIYGKVEEVMILSADLLWKPTGSLIRFVFAMTSRGPIILMCSDLTMAPVDVLELYCSRIRIEVMFDMLKNLLGVFSYRFWTKKLPPESRKPKKNIGLTTPETKNLPTVRLCWEAYERFVMLGVISLGILQIIALKYTNTVWEEFDGFLRTRSRVIPSERTVRLVIMNLVITNFFSLAPTGILREIHHRFRGKKNSLPGS
ncbi:MAG: transposase [Desulfobacterales bacterium]|nr:transposase [Desulfobacterales bacterium]